MLRNVELYGHLGKRFGKSFRLDVKSPSEAIRALQANCPEFMAYLSKNSSPGYRVVIDEVPVEEREELFKVSGEETIRIVPVIAGSGGIGQIFVGLGLVVIGMVTGNPYLVAMGASMTLGGIATLLSPSPTINESSEDPKNRPNYSFSGIVNTTGQGNPVPIIYGEVIAGGQIISAGLSVDSSYSITNNLIDTKLS